MNNPCRRLTEAELKSIEVMTNERIEQMVAKRVEEELERRKEEIETEVLRRVSEARVIMEQQMMEELEKRRQDQLAESKRREVRVKAMYQAVLARLYQAIDQAHQQQCRKRAPAL